MPKADEPNDQAPQSLDARIAAFEARKAAEKPERADKESLAPPAVQPAGAKDESERPIVNPVTGVAI